MYMNVREMKEGRKKDASKVKQTPRQSMYMYMYMYMLMRRKKEASKVNLTNNKTKQHSTPKAVTFPKKKELPQVGLVQGT